MKVIFIGKKEKWLTAIVIALLIGFIFSWQYFTHNAVPTAGDPYYHGLEQGKKISLTINVDWGEEYLPDMLKVLEENNVKATFFLTGRWAENNPALAKKIADNGHEIGNHAYSHTGPNSLSYEGNREEISKTAAAIKKATGVDCKLYAPPSGEKGTQVLQAAADEGYTTILWSIDTVDWKRPAPDVIIERVLKKAHPGGIILAHPTNPTLEALPAILQRLQDEGYQFVTVSENIGLKATEGNNAAAK
ncbi:MAG: polysaccharide deacetylase family protein [Bacillota bacterium]|jgi:probable sporulation protein (polysaccharide deacetylase family)